MTPSEKQKAREKDYISITCIPCKYSETFNVKNKNHLLKLIKFLEQHNMKVQISNISEGNIIYGTTELIEKYRRALAELESGK